MSSKIEGFDLLAGQTWIYPTNYPTRDYQFNIVKEALFKNTLVSLPTGLGKTFIAAVVMYNFYRWYPHGKIIFMAPTRPLVKQQIDACYNIMAIPEGVTAELTGSKLLVSRSNIWREKRVFFVTPQVLQNDLENVAQLGEQIKCLVFDEAHKAKGNHAYCQVIRKLLSTNHHNFRVLALSATPGCNVNDVSEVVHNLLISHLEFRTEESKDVKSYVFERSLETVVVHLDDKLIEIREEYMKIVEYYARTLKKFNIIQGNYCSLSKGKIFMLMKDFQDKNRGTNSSNYSEIMRCLNICVTLYHALELLIRHGLRNFLSFFDEHIEKPLLRGNNNLKTILENVRNYLGPIPQIEVLPDGTYPEIPKNLKFGHPKHHKLKDILLKHFTDKDKENSRVIVFFEYRESVMEAHTILLQARPLIKPKIFLGQGCGVTQKIQIGVVKAFKEGRCNTLLSTCIGEEGLDVGEVDLIICFDISNKSPVRMVQRMGRTGRKRAGNVLILVTEGKEQQTLKDCLIHKNNISTHVLGSTRLKNDLYPFNPRLVPDDLEPKCEKLFITVKKKTIDKLKQYPSSSDVVFSQPDEFFQREKDLIPGLSKMLSFEVDKPSLKESTLFKKHVEKMRTGSKTYLISHSNHSKALCDLLSYADAKRFNIPTKICNKTEDLSGKSLKQSDIRSMFKKDVVPVSIERTQSQTEYSLINTQECSSAKTSLSEPLEHIFDLLSDYLFTDLITETQKCSLCPQDFDCSEYLLTPNGSPLKPNQVFIPKETILYEITLENIDKAIKSMDESFFAIPDDSELFNEDFSESFSENSKEKSLVYEAPDNYKEVLEKIEYAQDIASNSQLFNADFSESFSKNSKEKSNIYEIPSNFKEVLEKVEFTQDIPDDSQLFKKKFSESFGKNSNEKSVIYETPSNYKGVFEKDAFTQDIPGVSQLFNEDFIKSFTKNSKEKIVIYETPRNNKEALEKVEFSQDIPDDSQLFKKDFSESFSDNFKETSIIYEAPRNYKEALGKVEFSQNIEILESNQILSEEELLKVFKLEDIFDLFDRDIKKYSQNTIIYEPVTIECSPNKSNIFDIEEICDLSYFGLTKSKIDATNISFVNENISNSINGLNDSKELNCSNTSNVKATAGCTINDHSFISKSTVDSETIKEKNKNLDKSESDLDDATQVIDLTTDSSKENEKEFEAAVSPDIFLSSSSDEFFQKPTCKKVLMVGSKRAENSKNNSLFNRYNNKKAPITPKSSRIKIKKDTKLHNEFLDMEATVAEDENVSEDESEHQLDAYEESFVNDETENFDTEMHGVYLQSVKSPSVGKRIRTIKPIRNLADVYSQLPPMEESEYIEDSFCVNKIDEELTQNMELSHLEILEKQLEEGKRKRRLRNPNQEGKRKRIRLLVGSDESD
ncbi:hypothetical protein ABEB36_007419 [Hypothenemus hampei]